MTHPADIRTVYRRYFKWTIASPLWLPAIIWVLIAFLAINKSNIADYMPEWILGVVFILAASLVYGGLQYLITLMILWRRIDFNDTKSWMRNVLFLPLLFTPIQSIGIVLIALVMYDVRVIGDMILYFSGFSLAVGYSYVLLWLVGFGLLRLVIHLR